MAAPAHDCETEDPYDKIIRKAYIRLAPNIASTPAPGGDAAASQTSSAVPLPASIVAARLSLEYRRAKSVPAAPASEKKQVGISRRGVPLFWRERQAEVVYSQRAHDDARECAVSRATKWAKVREQQEKDMRRPVTKEGLVRFLVSLIKQRPPASFADLVELHSHSSFLHLVSTQSYAIILQQAHKFTNLRRLRDILDEMHERGIGRDEWIARTLLDSALSRGKETDIEAMLAITSARGWGGFPIFNGRGMDLGDSAKEKKVRRKFYPSLPPSISPLLASTALSEKESNSLKRPDGRPSDVASLPGNDITTLAEALFQNGDSANAYRIVDNWLENNRPPPLSHQISPPPLDLSGHFSPRIFELVPLSTGRASASYSVYAKTAIILLNTLLKALIRANVTDGASKKFIVDFLARHSPPGYPSLLPNEATLRTFLWEYKAAQSAFYRASRMVNWFGYTYGFPPEGALTGRRTFPRKLVVHTDSATSTASPPVYETLPSPSRRPDLYPINEVSVSVSLDILKSVARSFSASSSTSPTESNPHPQRYEQMHQVRKWWMLLDKGSPEWRSKEARRVLKRIYETGLLDYDTQGKELDGWKDERKVVLTREREEEAREKHAAKGRKWDNVVASRKRI